MELPLHQGLREEIMALKKRVIELETAEADCTRLKKAVQMMKKQMHEEKSRMEMDFMNQVSAISQANALKVEEVECQLKESTAVNRALNEQLEKCGGVEKKMQQMEIQQEKEIARIVDNKIKEIEDIQGELGSVSKTKDELAVKLGEAQTRVEAERKKVEELNASFLNESQADKTKIDALEAQLSHSENENAKLQKLLEGSNVEQPKVKALEEKLSNAQKEIDMLKSNVDGNNADNAKVADLESRLEEARQDNKTLSRELKTLSETKKGDLALSNTVRDLREKLRSRDSELNAKIKEIALLETKLEGLRSQSTASLDVEVEVNRLKKQLDDVVASRNEKEMENSRLRSDCRKLQNRLDSSQDENEQGNANQGVDSEVRSRAKTGSTGRRASKIIQQLEENLRRESQNKQVAVVTMKAKAAGNDKAAEIKIHALKAELNNLKQELEWEQDATRKLREEIQEMKEQKVGNKSVQPSCSATSYGVRESKAAFKSQAAVKGIVQSFEKKISTDSTGDSGPTSMHGVDERRVSQEDLGELKEELRYEREQVLELEDELTRQCEINCALLKEISNLSCENDAARVSAAKSYGVVNSQNYGEDQQEIDRLIMEVANVRSQLFNAEQSKSKLEDHCGILTEKHTREINALKEKLDHASMTIKSISSRMEECSSLDRKEIDSLQKKLRASEASLEELRGGNSLVTDVEKELKETKKHLEEQKHRMETLQKELSDVKDAKASIEQENEKISEELKSLRTMNEDREHLSSEQQEQFDFLQKTVDEKVQEFEKLRSNDKEEINRLRQQAKSLEEELSEKLDEMEQLKTAIKEKEDMESTVDELSRKNVQALHAQINKLQKQLTNKHVEDSETDTENRKKIAALEEAIDSMQMEMEEIMREKEIEMEDLKRAIADKERKAMLLEKEKEQLILSMNDMMKSRRDEIDELQTELMEMSTRSAHQSREMQTLKLQLEESGYGKDEMQRLRARVHELDDRLTSNGAESPSLEIENNDLRQKLRDAVADRQEAEEKLREYVAEKDGSKQVHVLRERNAALKNEVEKLTKKMRKLTDSFTKGSPRSSTSSRGKAAATITDSEVETTRFVI